MYKKDSKNQNLQFYVGLNAVQMVTWQLLQETVWCIANRS